MKTEAETLTDAQRRSIGDRFDPVHRVLYRLDELCHRASPGDVGVGSTVMLLLLAEQVAELRDAVADVAAAIREQSP